MGTDSDCGRRAWRLLFDLAMTIHAKLPCVAADLGLSVPQCHVLRVLQPGHPVIMGKLARLLGCDASNVTGIVDRLEATGLVERRFAASDRRVRMLGLTERGSEIRATLLDRLYDPPSTLLELSDDRQRELFELLQCTVGSDEPDR